MQKNSKDLLSEPGYYKENDFGIRIEDVVVIKPAKTKVDTQQSFVDNQQLFKGFPFLLSRYSLCEYPFLP